MKSRLLCAIVISWILGAPGICGAQDRVFISPYLGVYLPDDDRSPLESAGLLESESDNALVVGVRTGIQLDVSWRIELSYGAAWYEARRLGSTIEQPEPSGVAREAYSLHQVELGVLWFVDTGRPLRPYAMVAAGMGVVSYDVDFFPAEAGDSIDDREGTIALGIGVVWRARESLGVRLDFRDHLRFCGEICSRDQTLQEFELTGGVELPL